MTLLVAVRRTVCALALICPVLPLAAQTEGASAVDGASAQESEALTRSVADPSGMAVEAPSESGSDLPRESGLPSPPPPSSGAPAAAEPAALDSNTAAPVSDDGSAPAQPELRQVSGVVRIKGTGVPLEGALVFQSDDKKRFAKTAADGSFSLEVDRRAAAVSIRRPGFNELEVQLNADGLVTGSNVFVERSATYREVGIIRARQKTEVSQQSLERSDLENIAGSGGDAVRGLQSLPSVLPTGTFSANIVVRGGAPGDNQYYYDRLRLPFVFHLGGLGSVVPLRMLTGVDLYAGGFSALYPDATSAIIQLKSDTSIPERFAGEVEVSLIQSSAYIEGNMFRKEAESPDDEQDDGVGYRAGFRRSYLELLTPLFSAASSGPQILTVPQITDYQFVLNGKHGYGRGGTWQFYLLGAADRLKLIARTSFSDNAEGESSFSLFNYFQTMGLRHSTQIGNGLGLTFVPQQTFVLIDQQFFDNIVKVKQAAYSLDTFLTKNFSKSLTAVFGVRPEVQLNTTDVNAIQIPPGGISPFFDPDTAPRNEEKRKRQVETGVAYVDVLYEPTERLVVNPGLMYQRGNTSYQEEIDPRIAARYAVVEDHTLKAAWGQYSQRPNPAFDTQDYGNPRLRMERADHYVVGWEYSFLNNWSSDVQAYYKELYQLVGPNLRNPADIYDNNVKGRAKGVEVLIKKNPSGRWDGWFSYGYSVSERQDPLNMKWRLSEFDRTHAVSVVGKYKVTGQWTLGGKLEYLTGIPYTDVKGGVYNQNTGRYRPDVTAELGVLDVSDKRAPDYLQLDLRSDYDVWLDTWSYKWFVELLTAPLGANVVGGRWSPDYSKREWIRGLPVVPNVGIKATF
jgi:hypothetical protein